MTRLAFVSPLPPARSGIADYACDVLELLADRFELDAFHDQGEVDRARLPSGCGVHPARELPARQAERAYDAVVYQLGNGLEHAVVYELLPRVGGLLVLHDLVLHHSRASLFLESSAARAYAADPSSAALREAAMQSVQAYRDEVAYTYPAQAARLADAHLNTVGTLLPYAFPLFRLPVESARLVAVHNEFMRRAIADEVPHVPVVCVPMPVRRAEVTAGAVAAIRARHGFRPDEVVVGCFGLLTPEKRVATVARAVARAAAALPQLRLLLVGPLPPRDPEGAALLGQLERLGARERTIVAGRVSFEELPAYMQAADVAVHLRYPTARETSAALLRLLAQGRPVVMSDLEHQAEVPAGAVVRADPRDEEGEVTRALLALAERPDRRERLGRAAAAFAAREHSPERCREAYLAAIEEAARRPDPRPRAGWPAHWRPLGGAAGHASTT